MLTEKKIFNAIRVIHRNKGFSTISEISKQARENRTLTGAAINLLISQGRLRARKVGTAKVMYRLGGSK